MSSIDCGACQELRENAPEFVENGVTSTVCTSLQNDTGLNPNLTVTHTDAEDLHTANDCLIGQMDAQLEAFDTCDWKKFMHRFIPNVYEMLKAIICSLKGIWLKIHVLENSTGQYMRIKRHELVMDNIECGGYGTVNCRFDLDMPEGYTYMGIGTVEVQNASLNGAHQENMTLNEYHTSDGLRYIWVHYNNVSSTTARIKIKVNVLFCTSANIEYIGQDTVETYYEME